ncbi:MAG: SGNH/GDSL hydrolase family protein [Clostridia bacterium]|nr:SGNH/GDSL hydrolase family protein [Clostridia bacterium]
MKILFQGDSITDAGRDRSNIHNLGAGYPYYAAEAIKAKYPDIEFEFINQGIGGDRAESLLARWESEAIAHDPDIISILIGVNDTWHHSNPNDNWMKHSYFEHCYRSILTALKEKTHAKIILIEQFLLYTPDKAYFREDLAPKIEITRKLAREFADAYIPMDGLFAMASVGKEPTYWAQDGVHPTEAGAKLMADYYLNAISPLIEALNG